MASALRTLLSKQLKAVWSTVRSLSFCLKCDYNCYIKCMKQSANAPANGHGVCAPPLKQSVID